MLRAVREKSSERLPLAFAPAPYYDMPLAPAGGAFARAAPHGRMRAMARSILITQCLQNDFVKPIGRFDPLPNGLHIGHAEAHRLLGDTPAESPLNHLIAWAYREEPERLRIIHVRDWHDAGDPVQATHLQQFGPHCLADSSGADFVFDVPAPGRAGVDEIRGLTLNDFQGTSLDALLRPLAQEPVHIGIVGVWTEAKVLFLAYELTTRYPGFRIAVCSALTASSSRAQHFLALQQLDRILGVRVYDSVGEFIESLGGAAEEYPLPGVHADRPRLDLAGPGSLPETDRQLLRYLFRDCRQVRGRALDGGFSGNVVLGTVSTDLHGHEQAPHVVKIGPRNAIGQERAAFERIEEVLGNSAPRISDFADFGGRGALKYRYASMGAGPVSTFQKRYLQGMSAEAVRRALHTVFVEQLGRLYAAEELESCNLLDYYCFSSKWKDHVRTRVAAILGAEPDGPELRLPCGPPFPNPCRFYAQELDRLSAARRDTAYFAYVHGDLNGANIILDGHDNVWLIDFFHTHRGHVLKDLVKLENDLLYIFTPLPDAAALERALRVTDLLLDVEDLAAPLPPAEECGVCGPDLCRAWETLRVLRGFYAAIIRADRSALQWRIAAMRYAVHTLSFDECNVLQKQWALYTAGRLSASITATIEGQGPLRLDKLDPQLTAPGTLAITILPGRRDIGRSLDADLGVIVREGVTDVLCLVPEPELAHYGVPDLLARYAAQGLRVRHLPMLDQKAASAEGVGDTVRWLRERLAQGAHVVVHCAGGLGRSGLVAACLLRSTGLSAAEAIAEVRRARSPRAIENAVQEAFIESFV